MLPDNGGVRSGSGSGIGNGEEDGDSLVGILGRLTNVGWRDRIGYVGVKCEGKAACISYLHESNLKKLILSA